MSRILTTGRAFAFYCSLRFFSDLAILIPHLGGQSGV
jgi:hypothetical protein